jgi:hypothetical protein
VILVWVHVDVLVGACCDGEVNGPGGLKRHAQALLQHGVAWPAQDEKAARIEREPDLVSVCDAVPIARWTAAAPEVEGDRLVAGQESW